MDRYQILDRGTPELKVIGRTWAKRCPSYLLRQII
jgi:hypothetical protein